MLSYNTLKVIWGFWVLWSRMFTQRKKKLEKISTFKCKAAYSSYPSQAAGITKPLEFRPHKHISVFGADWLVKSLGQKTSLVF